MTPAFEYTMTYWERIEGPMEATSGSAHGDRICWKIAEATLKGPAIDARLAMPATDWMRLARDGTRRPDARIQLVTPDGHTILFHYQVALIRSTDVFLEALKTGAATAFEDQYMRISPQFETAAGSYSWMEQSLFVGLGRLAGPKEIEYQLFKLL
jgi:Protein of unknown function (DUF3237)